MRLPDGTTADVIGLSNKGGTINATVQVLDAAGKETIAWLTVTPLVEVACGQIVAEADIIAAKDNG